MLHVQVHSSSRRSRNDLLVDLGSPQFEAILFAVLACSFYLLESFVDDLEDPFGGSWTVDAALEACDELVDALAVEE